MDDLNWKLLDTETVTYWPRTISSDTVWVNHWICSVQRLNIWQLV